MTTKKENNKLNTEDKVKELEAKIASLEKKDIFSQVIINRISLELEAVKVKDGTILDKDKEIKQLKTQNNNFRCQAKEMERAMIKIEQESAKKDKQIKELKNKIKKLEAENEKLRIRADTAEAMFEEAVTENIEYEQLSAKIEYRKEL